MWWMGTFMFCAVGMTSEERCAGESGNLTPTHPCMSFLLMLKINEHIMYSSTARVEGSNHLQGAW